MEAPEVSKINEALRSQPVCTAIQIALVELLREWGIKPEAVIGHSSGRLSHLTIFYWANQLITYNRRDMRCIRGRLPDSPRCHSYRLLSWSPCLREVAKRSNGSCGIR